MLEGYSQSGALQLEANPSQNAVYMINIKKKFRNKCVKKKMTSCTTYSQYISSTSTWLDWSCNPTRTTDSHLKRIISTNCCIPMVITPDDGPRYARNMQWLTKYTKSKLCIKSIFFYTIISRCMVNKTQNSEIRCCFCKKWVKKDCTKYIKWKSKVFEYVPTSMPHRQHITHTPDSNSPHYCISQNSIHTKQF